MSLSLWPNDQQHTRLPCQSLSPRVCSNSCPLTWWWYLTISSSATLFSFCLQYFLASRSTPASQLFTSGGQVLEFQLQYQSSQWIVRVDFLLDFLLDSSLLSKELSRVLSSTTFENVSSSVFSLLYGPTFTFIHDYWKNYSFDYMDLCWQIDVSAFQYTVRWFVITILPRSSSLSQINISPVEFMIPFLWSSKMSPNQ